MSGNLPCPERRSGFTLIELLVVIAIISILVGLLLPAVQKVREAAARSKCQNNLHQLAIGFHNFHDQWGVFPFGRSRGDLASPSWAAVILPYIEQGTLWSRFTDPYIPGYPNPFGMITRGDPPTVITHNLIRTEFKNSQVMQTQVRVYNCPARRPRVVQEQFGSGITEGIAADYGVCYGSGSSAAENNNGAFEYSCGVCGTGRRLLEITDGVSNTFFVGEKHVTPAGLGVFDPVTGAEHDLNIYSSQPGAFSYVTGRKAGDAFPLAIDKTVPFAGQFGSWHQQVVQFAFGDGSVRTLKVSTAGSILARLSSRNDAVAGSESDQ